MTDQLPATKRDMEAALAACRQEFDEVVRLKSEQVRLRLLSKSVEMHLEAATMILSKSLDDRLYAGGPDAEVQQPDKAETVIPDKAETEIPDKAETEPEPEPEPEPLDAEAEARRKKDLANARRQATRARKRAEKLAKEQAEKEEQKPTAITEVAQNNAQAAGQPDPFNPFTTPTAGVVTEPPIPVHDLPPEHDDLNDLTKEQLNVKCRELLREGMQVSRCKPEKTQEYLMKHGGQYSSMLSDDKLREVIRELRKMRLNAFAEWSA